MKPWYKVATPREDLAKGKPLDAAEFAVHLGKVKDKSAPADYMQPHRFFQRTYMTENLTVLASQVIRRLSGEITETSAVFNLATQFGGGKTHALTLLFHLAENGPAANGWAGVSKLLARAGISSVPRAATAVFVGNEFDSIRGRGGDNGEPIRKTPWGEIAFQLGGKQGMALVAEHERQMVAPAGDVIRQLLPVDKPCLILMDELMSYMSMNRKSGLGAQLYNFIQNLSETVRSERNVVLAVSIPASELEMTAEDQSDYERLKKMLDRLGKAIVLSAETETSEIIRRRLFEWEPGAVGADGRVLLSRDAQEVCNEFSEWAVRHRHQIPGWFPVDRAREEFAATYPFHPMVLSVFQRKWQALPRFQQTRGILRLLALWVSRAYQEGYRGAHRDPLIGLGTAPLDDSLFRAAAFEQLGESRLEGAVTTDICGKSDSHAIRLDNEAVDTIRKARLHRKAATVVFFESNGGQARHEATVPEVRLAVAEPELDVGNVDIVLEALQSSCYFLSVEGNRYRFSLSPNLNKLLADRRATIGLPQITDRVRSEVQKVFAKVSGIECIYFPEAGSAIPDRPILTLNILSPELSMHEPKRTVQQIESMTKQHGSADRTFKSALVWAISDSDALLKEEARKVLAWESIEDEAEELGLDPKQRRQLSESLGVARRDLKESVWRSYKHLALLDKSNTIRVVDLGLVHSSAADSMVAFILGRLRADGDLEATISPNFLVRNWPPAFREWSTKNVRDAFFASPQFPRLLSADVIKETISRGVAGGVLAYLGKAPGGEYQPFHYKTNLSPSDVEISDDMFIVTATTAVSYVAAREVAAGASPPPVSPPTAPSPPPGGAETAPGERGQPLEPPPPSTPPGPAPTPTIGKLTWSGDLPHMKWMNFYTKVLTRFAAIKGLRISVRVEASPEGGISTQKLEETKVALRELGLDDEVETE